MYDNLLAVGAFGLVLLIYSLWILVVAWIMDVVIGWRQ